MKKLITLAFIGLLFISCSSDDSGSGLSNSASAKSKYDDSNYGVYKGVFVGSSGVITINIKNNGSVTAKLKLDGNTYNFTTTESVTEDASTSNLTFTSGDKSFDFAVFGNGLDPVVYSLNIPGHAAAQILVRKEMSDAIVKCYQGTYTGTTDEGIFNVLITDQEVAGLARSTVNDENFIVTGTNTGSLLGGTYSNGTFSGSISGNNVSGEWNNLDSASGTWSGHRTL